MAEPQTEGNTPATETPPDMCPRCLKNRIDPTKEKICGDCMIAERDADDEPPVSAPPAKDKPRPGQPMPGTATKATPAQARPAANGNGGASTKSPPPGSQALDKARPASPRTVQTGGYAPTIRKGSNPEEGLKFLLYGDGGVGKTTILSAIPDVLLVEYERTPGLPPDVATTPAPQTHGEFLRLVRWLKDADHPYKALAIDTADEWEAMILRSTVEKANAHKDQTKDAEHIEHVGGGYKKGYVAAQTLMREGLAELEQLRRARGMTIAFAAHEKVERRRNPEGEDFDYYTTNLHPDVGRSLIYDWTDATFRCAKVIKTMKQGKRGKAKGVGGEDRVLVTDGRDAWQAKNRFDLPLRMPLEWRALAAALEQWRSPQLLRAAIDEALAIVGDQEVEFRGQRYIVRDLVANKLGDKPTRPMLAQVKNQLEARVEALYEAQAAAEEQAGGGE